MTVVGLHLESDPVDPEAIDVWVDGQVGDEACRFRLDTGAGTCRVRATDATRHRVVRGTSPGVSASGVCLGEDEIVIPLLRLGGRHIVDVAATRTPIEIDAVSLLGMSALGRYRRQFRFAAGELELTDSAPAECDAWFALDMHAAGQPTVAVRFGHL